MKITRSENVTSNIEIVASDSEGDAFEVSLLNGIVEKCNVKINGGWKIINPNLLSFAIEHREEFYQMLKEIEDVKAKQQGA